MGVFFTKHKKWILSLAALGLLGGGGCFLYLSGFFQAVSSLEELRAYLDQNFAFTRQYLAEHLPRARMRISEATYLAWVDLSAYFEPEEHLPTFFAYEAGVLLEGGDMFVQSSDCFIRLNLACPRSILTEGLRRICEAVDTRHTERYTRTV